MDDSNQLRLLNSVYSCLLPLAKLLLRAGITYRQFDEVAKRAFVREAADEGDVRGRPANTSRVAVRTGLSRKDVKRVREALELGSTSETGSHTDRSGPPARVLHAWHVDRRFLGKNGRPRDLEFQDDERGFCALVRAVAGDVPPGAVRAELKRAGAVVEQEDGRLRAVKRYYVPGNLDEKVITVISGMVYPLTAGIVHNSDPGRASDGFIQRFAFTDNLDQTAVPQFRKWSRDQATDFIERVDDWLAQHEVPGDEKAVGNLDRPIVGIGVFYFEGAQAGDSASQERTA